MPFPEERPRRLPRPEAPPRLVPQAQVRPEQLVQPPVVRAGPAHPRPTASARASSSTAARGRPSAGARPRRRNVTGDVHNRQTGILHKPIDRHPHHLRPCPTHPDRDLVQGDDQLVTHSCRDLSHTYYTDKTHLPLDLFDTNWTGSTGRRRLTDIIGRAPTGGHQPADTNGPVPGANHRSRRKRFF